MTEQKKQNLSDPKVRKRFVTYKEATPVPTTYDYLNSDLKKDAPEAGSIWRFRSLVVMMTTS